MKEGAFEPEESIIIVDHFPNIDVFVDIGANVGYFSSLAKSRGKEVISVAWIKSSLARR